MINYIKSETYRNLRQKSLYVFLILGLLFIAIVTQQSISNTLKYNNHFNEADFFALMRTLIMAGGCIFAAVFTAFSQKSKGVHIQMVSSGLSRMKIFFGDFIMINFTMLVFAIIYTIASIIAAKITGVMVAEHNQMVLLNIPAEIAEYYVSDVSFAEAVKEFLKYIVYFYFGIMALNSMAMGLGYLLSNKGLAIGTYTLIALIIPIILGTFAFEEGIFNWVLNFSPYKYLLNYGMTDEHSGFIICIVTNIVFWLTSSAIYYKKKEL